MSLNQTYTLYDDSNPLHASTMVLNAGVPENYAAYLDMQSGNDLKVL